MPHHSRGFGQQQLLLLVLGIVIVVLAVVVGIQAFGDNQKRANSDALVNDAVRIASDAQAWKLKPNAFGGGVNDADWRNFSLEKLGYQGFDATYSNLNGDYTAGSDGDSALVVRGTSAGHQNEVQVGVFGTTPECIDVSIGEIGYVEPPTKPANC